MSTGCCLGSRCLVLTLAPPQIFCHRQWIDFSLLPPTPLITSGVIFRVMDCAKRHREFITHFKSKPSALGVPNVVGV
jgi:hypothetical protein